MHVTYRGPRWGWLITIPSPGLTSPRGTHPHLPGPSRPSLQASGPRSGRSHQPLEETPPDTHMHTVHGPGPRRAPQFPVGASGPHPTEPAQYGVPFPRKGELEHEPQASAGWDSRSGSVSRMGGSPLGSLLCEMGAEQTSCDTVGLWPPHTGLCRGLSKALSPSRPIPHSQFRLLFAGARERCSRPVFTRGRRAGTGQDPDGPGKGDLHPGLSRRSDGAGEPPRWPWGPQALP